MNVALAMAALLSLIAGPLHSFLGERLIFARLKPESLPAVGDPLFTHRTLRAFWHLVSVAWWGFAAILGFLATRAEASWTDQVVLLVVGVTFIASAVLAASMTRGRHFAWGILLAIAVAVFIGAL